MTGRSRHLDMTLDGILVLGLDTFFQLFGIGSIVACTPTIAAVILPAEAAGMRPRERRITRWRA